MSWRDQIVNRLSTLWLTVYVGIGLIGYFGVEAYKQYVDLKKTEIIYASQKTATASVRPEGEKVIRGVATGIETRSHIRTASSTY